METRLCRYLTLLLALCFLMLGEISGRGPSRAALSGHSFIFKKQQWLFKSTVTYLCFYIFNTNLCQSGPKLRHWQTAGVSLITGPPRGLNDKGDANNLAFIARLNLDSGYFEVTFGPLVIFLQLRTSVGGGDGLLIGCLDGWFFADVSHWCWIQAVRLHRIEIVWCYKHRWSAVSLLLLISVISIIGLWFFFSSILNHS